MSNLSVFSFESQEVRFVGTAEKPEWVGADVCACLQLSDTSKALETLELDEKGTKNVRTPGGEQEMLTVTEAGLYRLIFKSRKPIAKRFQRWVFHEVLPSIRKTGIYSVSQGAMTQIQIIAALAQQMAEQEQRLLEQERQQAEVLARLKAVEVEQDRFNTPCGHKYTIMGFAKLQGLEISLSQAGSKGKKASALCRKQGIEVEQIHDPRFGHVGLYPQSILNQVFSTNTKDKATTSSK
ncbi:BRO family protein (plasmid) [Nostoc sp. UHCC 0302]|uniref:BRO-N domain-containing protein n=1 Tax=Nostoc sp. UHCC 0302 TaxID=3134896 RepID=UPI00311CD52A